MGRRRGASPKPTESFTDFGSRFIESVMEAWDTDVCLFLNYDSDLQSQWIVMLEVLHEFANRYGVRVVSDLTPETVARYIRTWTIRFPDRVKIDHLRLVTGAILEFAAESGEIPPETYDVAEDLAGDWRRSNPLAIAEEYRQVMDLHRCSVAELARRMGVSSHMVRRRLALLDLPNDVRKHVEEGELATSTAFYLGKIPETEGRRRLIAMALAGQLTRNDAAAREQLSSSGERRKARRVVRTSKCPIQLHGRGQPVTVLGRSKPPLSDARYDVVRVLFDAFPGRVSKHALLSPRKTGGGGSNALHNLRALGRDDPDWAKVISLPGKAGGKYGLVAPAEATPTDPYRILDTLADADDQLDGTLKRIDSAGAAVPAS